MHRRQVFTVIGTSTIAMVAGCSSSPNVDDISIQNRTNEQQTVTLTVTQSETGESLLNERRELSADEEVAYEEVVGEVAATVRVTVDELAEETREWSDPQDAAGMSIELTPEGIELSETVA